MLEFAAIEVGHGRQADVGMRPNVDALPGQEFRRTRLVEEDERPDHLPLRRGQGAPHLEVAEVARARHDQGFDRVGADGVRASGFERRVPAHARLQPRIALIWAGRLAAKPRSASGARLRFEDLLAHRFGPATRWRSPPIPRRAGRGSPACRRGDTSSRRCRRRLPCGEDRRGPSRRRRLRRPGRARALCPSRLWPPTTAPAAPGRGPRAARRRASEARKSARSMTGSGAADQMRAFRNSAQLSRTALKAKGCEEWTRRARWCCSPAARIRPPVWPGRSTASTGSRRSASIIASAIGSNSKRVPKLRAAIAAAFPHWGRKLGDDHVLDLAALAEVSDSAMTRDVAIAARADGLPNTFVPGRNLLFLTFAAALAYRRGVRRLVTGVCETDYSGYPDCRDDTIKALQVALNLGMATRFVIETPLMWVDKAATWRLARDLGGETLVDIVREETHTCYEGDRSHRHEWGLRLRPLSRLRVARGRLRGVPRRRLNALSARRERPGRRDGFAQRDQARLDRRRLRRAGRLESCGRPRRAAGRPVAPRRRGSPATARASSPRRAHRVRRDARRSRPP